MQDRREFLAQAALFLTLAAGRKILPLASAQSSAAQKDNENKAAVLNAALEAIIPEADGMPSAAGAGGLQYLQQLGWQYPEIQQQIGEFVSALSSTSQAMFGADFNLLNGGQRLQALTELERKSGSLFRTFVGYVYEAYYTQPKVLGQLACVSSPTDPQDDLQLLAPVRKLGRAYREVE